MTSITARRPSSVLSELNDQLLEELRRLEDIDEHTEEPDLFRAYLRHFLALAWEGVARGNLKAPREALDHLLAAQPFVDAHRPHLGPAAQAAVEVEGVIRSFYLAVRVLALAQAEARLADHRSATEREVLRVLLESRREYLRRRDIHKRIVPEIRPTLGRVGQILADLYHSGLLKRIHSRAQGNPNASFYALSSRGLDVCQILGMEVSGEEEVKESAEASWLNSEGFKSAQENVQTLEPQAHGELFHQMFSSLLDPNLPKEWRSMLAGCLANLPFRESVRQTPAQILDWMGRSSCDKEAEKLLVITISAWSHRLSSLPAGGLEAAREAEFLEELISAVRRGLDRSHRVTAPFGADDQEGSIPPSTEPQRSTF